MGTFKTNNNGPINPWIQYKPFKESQFDFTKHLKQFKPAIDELLGRPT
jgi:hypothetical protein